MLKPQIASEWELLFKPEKYGNYVNDHCIIKDHDGKYHLFGITSESGKTDDERYFVHGRGGTTLEKPMEEMQKVIDDGTKAWAPCIIEKDNIYYMYYGPSVTKLAVTHQLHHWMGHQVNMVGVPPMAVHRDHMVFKENDVYIMYASGVKDGFSCISRLISKDLINWTFDGYALTSSKNAPLNPAWGAFESPYVVKCDDLYYLFTTYTNCAVDNYHNTLVFCSENPYEFGDYTGDNHNDIVVANIQAHAGEVIFDDNKNQWYITTCGWRNYSTPVEGGVAIAKLEWK